MIVHRAGEHPAVLFDDFDKVGCREGIANYVCFTHRINPMLALGPAMGVCRARDFAVDAIEMGGGIGAHLVRTPDEELGFHTLGWPQRQEEIGLYFETAGGIVEINLYRTVVGQRRLRLPFRCWMPCAHLSRPRSSASAAGVEGNAECAFDAART